MTKLKPADIEIPEDLKQHEELLREWFQFRSELGKNFTPTGLKRHFTLLRSLGADLAKCIETSMENGWQGVFPLKNAPKRGFQSRNDQGGKFDHLSR